MDINYRTDGLLAGSREERVQQMVDASHRPWNLSTLLEVHADLLDHAREVRRAAIEALIRIADLFPKPVQIAPVDLLGEFTGVDEDRVFRYLVERGGPAAEECVRQAVQPGMSTDRFHSFAKTLAANGRTDILQEFARQPLSAAKRQILRSLSVELAE